MLRISGNPSLTALKPGKVSSELRILYVDFHEPGISKNLLSGLSGAPAILKTYFKRQRSQRFFMWFLVLLFSP